MVACGLIPQEPNIGIVEGLPAFKNTQNAFGKALGVPSGALNPARDGECFLSHQLAAVERSGDLRSEFNPYKGPDSACLWALTPSSVAKIG